MVNHHYCGKFRRKFFDRGKKALNQVKLCLILLPFPLLFYFILLYFRNCKMRKYESVLSKEVRSSYLHFKKALWLLLYRKQIRAAQEWNCFFSSTLVRIKTKQNLGNNLSIRRKRGPSQIYNCLEITQSIISSEKSEGQYESISNTITRKFPMLLLLAKFLSFYLCVYC